MFPFTDTELEGPVLKSIDRVKEFILRDGGDITLVRIENAKVYVRLHGACVGCGSSNITIKNGIEQALRRDIHPDIEVIRLD